jgi:hypothetical protein
MAFEHEGFELFEGASHSKRLLEDVDAVGVGLNHAVDAVEVAVDVAESFEGFGAG